MLTTWQHRFGFKRKSSTSYALYCLKETIHYYTERNTNVCCSLLDAKEFDRLVHSGLFSKLLSRKVPLIFLKLIMYWYSQLQCRVRWGESHSTWFHVTAGVRQGVLSPNFCLYIDELVRILKQTRVGCYIRELFISALLYADDMALLAQSLKGLQILLKEYQDFCP